MSENWGILWIKRNGKNAKEITQPFYELFFFLAMNIDLNKFFFMYFVGQTIIFVIDKSRKENEWKKEKFFLVVRKKENKM